jgi:adenine-specific DNA-methyltransferase
MKRRIAKAPCNYGNLLVMTKSGFKKPPLTLQTTTLWDYSSQHYGQQLQGDPNYIGATPSYVIWNLLQRYTAAGDIVVDPMCGSGTTIDVCRDLERQSICFDLVPSREDIKQSDARHLPLKKNTIDFIFIDPPYADHIDYSDHVRCIGKTSAVDGDYYQEMQKVIDELHRILKPGGYLGLYVSDSFKKNKPFQPIGFRLLGLMEKKMEVIDIVAVTRHNRTLKRRHWHTAAEEGNYFLRGFNYLFVMRKPTT